MDKIRGVEVDIIERILTMIQEKYPAFDKGTYYLAIKFDLDNDMGFHNIRDMVSHFKTAISGVATYSERVEQISLAEEHLRRALVEPYEVAAHEALEEARAVHEQYEELIIYALEEDKNFSAGSSQETMRTLFREVAAHITAGREKKSANLWNGEWEKAVQEFTLAAEKALMITNMAKADRDALKQRNIYRQNKIYFRWAMVATIVSIILGVVALFT